MGISNDGAILMPPDGFVAWRSKTMSTNPVQQLRKVFVHILTMK
jgi:putative polyketide hydroxylase